MSLLTPSAEALLDLPPAEFQRRWRSLSPADQDLIRAETQRRFRVIEYPTPGDLAMALDASTVQTPALELVDSKLVEVAKAIRVMYARRRRLVELIAEYETRTGRRAPSHVKQEFIERAADEIPDEGINRLIISMPFQEGKSTRVNRYGLEWILRQFPELEALLVSYDGVNANRISYQVRSDIELFDGRFGNLDLGLRLKPDQKAMGRFMLTTGGGIYAIGIGGGLTGHPAGMASIDDPIKDIKAAESDLQIKQNMEWYQTTLRPRLAPWAPVILTTTRWGDNDLAGKLITKTEEDKAGGVKDFDDWEVVNISAQADYDPAKGETDVLGRAPGEFMLSARGRTQAEWETTKNATPPRFWMTMYQGNPTPQTGTILKRHQWRRYDTVMWARNPDGTFDVPGYALDQSWDMTFKDTDGTDYVVGGLWARKGSNSYLVWVIRSRMDFPATIDAFNLMVHRFPRSRVKLIESAANGPAVMSTLRNKVPGMIDVPTRGESKTSRARAAGDYLEAGNFWIPTSAVANATPELAWDPEGFIDECTAFPHGAHDDQVDMWSQYCYYRYIRHTAGRVVSSSEATIQQRLRPTAPVSDMAKRIAARRS